jgi:Bacterial TSP3 repeat
MKLVRLSLISQLAALATFGFGSVAHAKDEFPNEIKADFPLITYEVPCSVCHIKGNTGAATPITPFALSLRSRGLTGQNNSVRASLALAKSDGVDSDGDGVSDFQELINGTDPNSSADSSIVDDQEPGVGCGGTAPKGRAAPGLGSAVAAIWLFLRRRKSHSSAQRGHSA